MSDKPFSLWERFGMWWRWKLAAAATRWCGPAMLYWENPQAWEEYMLVASDTEQGDE